MKMQIHERLPFVLFGTDTAHQEFIKTLVINKKAHTIKEKQLQTRPPFANDNKNISIQLVSITCWLSFFLTSCLHLFYFLHQTEPKLQI